MDGSWTVGLRRTAVGAALVSGLAGCAAPATSPADSRTSAPPVAQSVAPVTPVAPVGDSVYAHQRAGLLDPGLRDLTPRVYVPNSNGDTVTVIDPATFRVVDRFRTGTAPQHVVPSYDLRRLWVNNNGANSLTEIDPRTARPVRTIPAPDPYNMYYTPDGRSAIVVAEAMRRLYFLDSGSMRPTHAIDVPDCAGINHLDFTVDGRYAVASCEFAGSLAKIDLVGRRQVARVDLGVRDGMPQDVRLAPDGRTFYVADMVAGGVHLIDGATLTKTGFLRTGIGAHGIYPSRAGDQLYVVNRGSAHVYGAPRGPGSISVVDPGHRQVVATWVIPGGGSPDMGNLSPDGRQLWLSGRYDDVVYCLDTRTGRLLARIPSGPAPHGLTYWPQPGRFSLGHTGNMR